MEKSTSYVIVAVILAVSLIVGVTIFSAAVVDSRHPVANSTVTTTSTVYTSMCIANNSSQYNQIKCPTNFAPDLVIIIFFAVLFIAIGIFISSYLREDF